jgi:hypothetical protein
MTDDTLEALPTEVADYIRSLQHHAALGRILERFILTGGCATLVDYPDGRVLTLEDSVDIDRDESPPVQHLIDIRARADDERDRTRLRSTVRGPGSQLHPES